MFRCGLVLLAGLSACRAEPRAPEPRAPSVHLIAEWEPAIGAMLAWPLYVPDALVQEIARDDLLFVLAQPEHVEAARSRMAELGIDAARVQYVPCSVESSWPRDWGPHQLFDREGEWTLVDHRFDGWPYYPRDAEPDGAAPEPTFVFRRGPGDDRVVGELARFFEAPVLELPLYLTGGNFLVDGAGTAFCTRAQLFENEPLVPEAAFRERVRELLGIERVVVLENTEPIGIQHIDCWLKVLDGERLLVKRAPAGHPEAAPLERNVALLSGLKTAHGRPWHILRIDCPEFPGRRLGASEGPTIAAYTNALILNGKVLIPLFGIPGDAAALATWRAAMPDHRVIGFEWDRWQHFDALHCRARAVFAR